MIVISKDNLHVALISIDHYVTQTLYDKVIADCSRGIELSPRFVKVRFLFCKLHPTRLISCSHRFLILQAFMRRAKAYEAKEKLDLAITGIVNIYHLI